ncbi:DUF2975 domain-containing protein [Phaeovibrio sulfidiphilus]|uniref:DUF2975 domain-containing protein n=1 Tax=Phaeovibrio sulfidiphilus TaxID=1220600 RepID=A0A8J6YMR4_9PROT|nr:DUF2975 domain-containing protein [Phaeovibrio sulfidiphilus]MBE1237603.1 DUF2975 domain-containing protein [Phaeovibrio sulfidiphilus]
MPHPHSPARGPVLASALLSLLIPVLIAGMLLLNAATWTLPDLASADARYGLSFALSDRLIASGAVDPASLSWWQTAGAVVISSLPLLVLASGLLHLRRLFRHIARTGHMSLAAPSQLMRLGTALLLWALTTFVCEPLLSTWTTLQDEERLLSLSVGPSDLAALFAGVCLVVLARALRASVQTAPARHPGLARAQRTAGSSPV